MKKIISLMLVLLLSLGITTIAMAAPANKCKITGMARDLSHGYAGDPDLGEIAPQEKHVEYIELTDDMFTWDGGYVPAATPGSLSSSQIREAHLSVHTSNSRVVEHVALNRNKSRIEVVFVDELVSVKEQDFTFDVILTVNNKHQRDYAINFTGTLANPIIEAYSETDYLDISGGEVVEAAEPVKAIKLDLGGGISIHTKLSKDKRYYAKAERVAPDVNDSFANIYKTVVEVVTLKTIGLANPATTVKLGEHTSGKYVYAKDGSYLGTVSDHLPYQTIYYISSTQLDIPGATITEEVPVPSYSPEIPNDEVIMTAPVTGDVTYPPNVNDNPHTGR